MRCLATSASSIWALPPLSPRRLNMSPSTRYFPVFSSQPHLYSSCIVTHSASLPRLRVVCCAVRSHVCATRPPTAPVARDLLASRECWDGGLASLLGPQPARPFSLTHARASLIHAILALMMNEAAASPRTSSSRAGLCPLSDTWTHPRLPVTLILEDHPWPWIGRGAFKFRGQRSLLGRFHLGRKVRN